MPEISVIIPCYNEEKNVLLIYDEILKHISVKDYEIIFVDDGSRDNTVSEIKKLQKINPKVRLLAFLANSGHQLALKAGIHHAKGELIITLDADLQHPPSYIPKMIEKAKEGYDCVNMIRGEDQEGVLKNFFSRNFYSVFAKLSGVHVVPGSSDFRLITRTVQEIIKMLPERKIFLRALIPLMGFNSCNLVYELGVRTSGVPGYTFKKSFQMAKDAFLNYTAFPVRIFFQFGIFIAFISICYGIFIVGTKFLTDWNIPGYTDIVASVLFLGSLNLILFAVIGKYLQIILEHIKKRPEYIIDTKKGDKIDSN